MAQGGLVLSAQLDHIRGFLTVLLSIKQSKRQTATLVVDKNGISVYTFDDSKALQGSALFRAEVFKSFSFTPDDESFRRCFSCSLSGLADSVAVFTAADGEAPLQLRWPDTAGRLLLQLNVVRESGVGGAPVECCTYAEVGCEDSGWVSDLEGEMTNPRSSFTLPASVLRELVQDCGFCGSQPVKLSMRTKPNAAVSLRAVGDVAGCIEICAAAGSCVSGGSGPTVLQSFECVGEAVSATYKLKFLAAAACLPTALLAAAPSSSNAAAAAHDAAADASISQVQMDGQGMLRVKHLLNLSLPRKGGRDDRDGQHGAHYMGSAADCLTDPEPTGTGGGAYGTYGGPGGQGGASTRCPVTFVCFPEENMDAEEEEMRAAGEAEEAEEGGGRGGGLGEEFTPMA